MEIKLKVCLMGDQGVGKTSILFRYLHDVFYGDYQITLGMDFAVKEFALCSLRPCEEVDLPAEQVDRYNDSTVRLYIWDLGGQQQFAPLRSHYLAGAHATIIVYDVSETTTLKNLGRWIEQHERCLGDKPYIVVGNKTDLLNNDVVDDVLRKQGEMVSKGHSPAAVYFTSAKTGHHVKNLFEHVMSEILLPVPLVQHLFNS
ncbi:MAG: Rab family GTPase [Promethearchaeota archaeon]